jgi:3-deoxy-manno-octulosonate cytidylyltransferase (CMP-KDO synthetase)
MVHTTIGIIPARYQSTRFPAKPLVNLLGKSMIHRVYEGARTAQLIDTVIIATDHPAIAEECERHALPYVMTDPDLPSGTDRIVSALRQYEEQSHKHYTTIVNIQGDEPLISGAVLDPLVQELHATPQADVATPITAITNPDDLHNPAVVTVALTQNNRALYFSRSPIPFVRGAMTASGLTPSAMLAEYPYMKHIGIYAYRRSALEKFVQLPMSVLERTEQLEQLRLLEAGAYYHCVPTQCVLYAIDTPHDIAPVESALAKSALAKSALAKSALAKSALRAQ